MSEQQSMSRKKSPAILCGEFPSSNFNGITKDLQRLRKETRDKGFSPSVWRKIKPKN